jgi:hypothetical protein
MLSDLHYLLLDRLQQQDINTNEAPVLLRDRSKNRESDIGKDPAVAKGKLLLDNHRGTPHL